MAEKEISRQFVESGKKVAPMKLGRQTVKEIADD